jgi:hypothetical protein
MIILFTMALIGAPLLVGLGALLWLLYWYGLGGRHKNPAFLAQRNRIERKWLLLAALLTLLSLWSSSLTATAIHYGFPSTVITRYALPVALDGLNHWSVQLREYNLNPLQALLNWAFYLLLLLLLNRLWQSFRTWRKIGG